MSASKLPVGLDDLIMRMFRSSLSRPGMMSFGALEVDRAWVRY